MKLWNKRFMGRYSQDKNAELAECDKCGHSAMAHRTGDIVFDRDLFVLAKCMHWPTRGSECQCNHYENANEVVLIQAKALAGSL